MAHLSIRLFGKLKVQRQGMPVDGLDGRKAQELLSFLALYRDRSHAREALATVLWEDASQAHSKKYLRQALWQLHTALKPPAGAQEEPLILADGEWVGWNPNAGAFLDVEHFEKAALSVCDVPQECLDPATLATLEEGAQFYRADLLEGWFQDWCLFERERLQNLFLTLLEHLVAGCQESGCYDRGIYHSLRILRFDRAHEKAHRQLMRLHYLAGNRTMALRQYERCADVLAEELGVEPAESTKALYEEIRYERFPLRGSQPRCHLAGTPELPQLLSSLLELRHTLGELQGDLNRYIQDVEATLRRG